MNFIISFLTKPFFDYLPTDLAELLSAMVWGQKRALSSELYSIFQKTGLLHLLVLSGQNISLVVGFMEIFQGQVGYHIRLIFTILISIFYLIIFIQEPSIVRAGLMSIFSSYVVLRQRNTLPIFIFLLTLIIMLIFNSSWLSSLSFWLSASSTAGILLLYPSLKKKYPGPLLSGFWVSLSAQLFTLPIILLVFRETSLLSLPLNLIVGFLIEPIMFFGIILSLFGNFIPLISLVTSLILFGLLKIVLMIISLGLVINGFLTVNL